MTHIPYCSLTSYNDYNKIKVTPRYIYCNALGILTMMSPFILQFFLLRPGEWKYQTNPTNNMTFDYAIKDNICPTHYIEKINAYVSDCSNRNLTEIPGYVQFSNFECRKETVKCILNLNNNNISTFKFDEKIRSVTHLYLANNSLSEVRWIPRQIRELDLSNNTLGTIDSFISKDNLGLEKLEKLAVHRNPWTCNCSRPFIFDITGMLRQKLVNIEDLLCDDGTDWHTKCTYDYLRFVLLIFGLTIGTIFAILITVRTRIIAVDDSINYEVHFKNVSEPEEI